MQGSEGHRVGKKKNVLVFEEWLIQKMSSFLHGKPGTLTSNEEAIYSNIATLYLVHTTCPRRNSLLVSRCARDSGSPLSVVGWVTGSFITFESLWLFFWVSFNKINYIVILLMYKYHTVYLTPTTRLCFLNIRTLPYVSMSWHKDFNEMPYIEVCLISIC